jgi:hypothetical protein
MTLSLDCVQDHALSVDIYRQMALDAYEGEQRLNHTASNREHVWRLLQGGELIAPVPPLPPRETASPRVSETQPEPVAEAVPTDASPPPQVEASPPKKSNRGRKKAEGAVTEKETGSAAQTGAVEPPPTQPTKRGRKKKNIEETASLTPTEETIKRSDAGSCLQASTDTEAQAAPAKPKRTRRVGEPKPKRYPVGEQE